MADDTTPSWARPAAARAAPVPGVAPAPPPATLWAAAALTTALAAAEVAHVAGREELVPALRAGLGAVVALQVVLAGFVLRRSPGAALGLFLFELTVVVAALGGGFGERRLLFAAGAVVVAVLLGASLRAFPPPELPTIQPGGEP